MTLPLSPWLTDGTSLGAPLRLYCFPHGGGSAAEYVRWGGALRRMDVRVVQLPGRGARWREQPFTRMHSLVAAIANEVTFAAPYAFFGHSLGALVAYEVATALVGKTLQLPDRLFVSGHAAPSLPRRLPPIHRAPDEEFLAEVARRHGGIPAEAQDDPSLRAALIPPLRTDCEIVETYTYQPQPPLAFPITVLAGTDDVLSATDLAMWQDHTILPVIVHRFPGGHFYLRECGAPLLREIARTMRI